MKLYVGTYASYNRGSLRGAWVDLDKYDSKEEFLKACRRLHRSERDPEFMFQDVEYTWDEDWERNFYRESYIDAEYWDEMKAARARKLAEAKKGGKPLNAIRQEYAAALIAECDWMTDAEAIENAKKPVVVVKLTGGQLIAFNAPSIITSHCEGEDEGMGGPTVKEAQERCDFFKTREGFKAVNLEQMDDFKRNRDYLYLIPESAGRRGFNASTAKLYQIGQGCSYYAEYRKEISAEDWKRIDEAVSIARAAFEKRLDAYWKRYGASKLHTWTYWMSA